MIGIPEDTYALTQSELALRDGRSLAAMGIADETIKTFQLYGLLRDDYEKASHSLAELWISGPLLLSASVSRVTPHRLM